MYRFLRPVRRFTSTRFLAALAGALLIGGGAAPAGAADESAVRIATIPIDQAADVFYADDQGFFKQAGLSVAITVLESGPAIIGAVAGGSADFGNANSGSVAEAHERGIPVRFVAPAGLHLSTVPADLLMVGANSPIRSARDLDGKTVAVNAIGALPNVATKAWIAQNGGDIATVHFVEIPFPAMGQALASGRVDAAEMTEPFITSSKAVTRVLGNAFDAISKNFIVSGWLASDAWLSAHQDEATRFVTALRRAHEWANAHHAQSAAILARHTKMTLQTAQSMTRAVFGTTLDPALIQPVIATFSKFGDLPRPLAASDIIWSPPGSPHAAAH